MKVVIIKECIVDTELFREKIESLMMEIKYEAASNRCIVQPLLLQQSINETYIIETIIYDFIPVAALNQKVIIPQ